MNANSTMQRKADAYLSERRQAGFGLLIAGQQLARFARFIDDTGYRGPLTTELARRWALGAGEPYRSSHHRGSSHRDAPAVCTLLQKLGSAQ